MISERRCGTELQVFRHITLVQARLYLALARLKGEEDVEGVVRLEPRLREVGFNRAVGFQKVFTHCFSSKLMYSSCVTRS